jgi:hypothetical protein
VNLENQVCSLELSKRLKELGVKQESLFYYQNNPYNDGEECIVLMITEARSINNENAIINTECENNINAKIAAFIASELGELLPLFIEIERDCYADDGEYLWRIICCEHEIFDENETNARAKMLIYLLENKLMELEKD